MSVGLLRKVFVAVCMGGLMQGSSVEDETLRIGIWNIGSGAGQELFGDPPWSGPEAIAAVIADEIDFDIVVVDSTGRNEPAWRKLESSLLRRGYRVRGGGMPTFAGKAVAFKIDRVQPMMGAPLIFPYDVRNSLCRTQEQGAQLFASFRFGQTEFTLAAVRLISDSPDEGCPQTEAHVKARSRQAEILVRQIRSGQSMRPPLPPVREAVIIVGDLNATWEDPAISLLQDQGFALLQRLSRSARPRDVDDARPSAQFHHLFANEVLSVRWIPGSTTRLTPNRLSEALRNMLDFADFGSHLPLWADFDFSQAR